MKKVRKTFYVISVVAAILSIYFSFQTEYEQIDGGVSQMSFSGPEENYPVSNTIDSGVDGGAAGFAVLSGLALIAASITYLKDEDLITPKES